MKILLVGYGKMGRTIAALARQRGHEIAGIVDSHASEASIVDFTPAIADVAIEFTHPDSAFANVTACLRQGLPVVCGSTGWLHHFEEARTLTKELDGSLFYASNYSVGVNLFFHFNEYIAAKMSQFGGYDVAGARFITLTKSTSPAAPPSRLPKASCTISRAKPPGATPPPKVPPNWPSSASARARWWARTS